MKIYLVARYGRRLEMVKYREQLRLMGHEVTSRWVNGEHEALDKIAIPQQMREFAIDDVIDLHTSDLVIAFTEQPNSEFSRGGRHVEFGMALALNKEVIVVGPVENVFYSLAQVTVWGSWEEAIPRIEGYHKYAQSFV